MARGSRHDVHHVAKEHSALRLQGSVQSTTTNPYSMPEMVIHEVGSQPNSARHDESALFLHRELGESRVNIPSVDAFPCVIILHIYKLFIVSLPHLSVVNCTPRLCSSTRFCFSLLVELKVRHLHGHCSLDWQSCMAYARQTLRAHHTIVHVFD
jgi:hypothetical protein